MGSIYVIRHCQSIANSRRIYNCTIKGDEGLTELGKAQAAELAGHFAGRKVAKVYSSPFLRTRQTAERIAGAVGSVVELVEQFGELGCGDWDGRSESEIIEGFPDAWKGWHYDPQNNPIPGGETLLEVQARVLPEFERLAKRHASEDFAIVTHYCVLNVIVCSLVSSLASFRSFDTGNGTVAEISMENVPRLRSFGSPLNHR
ncbi:MAG: histidine phosphatase family protein [Candidatus Micrarchaeia archaeon]